MTRTSVGLWVDEGVVGEQGKTKHYRKAETAKTFQSRHLIGTNTVSRCPE